MSKICQIAEDTDLVETTRAQAI